MKRQGVIVVLLLLIAGCSQYVPEQTRPQVFEAQDPGLSEKIDTLSSAVVGLQERFDDNKRLLLAVFDELMMKVDKALEEGIVARRSMEKEKAALEKENSKLKKENQSLQSVVERLRELPEENTRLRAAFNELDAEVKRLENIILERPERAETKFSR